MTIKKILSIMTLAVCTLGCLDKVEYVDENSSALSGSTGSAVTGADAIAYAINQNILSLHTLLTETGKGEFVISSEEYSDSYGKGYRFVLTTEDSLVFYGNTEATEVEGTAPVIEAEKDQESGIYYWTLKGERLKDALGHEIPVSNPYVSVRAIGTDWCYSIDGGVEWTPVGKVEALANPYALAVAARGAMRLGNMNFTPAWMPLFYYTMEEEASVAAGFTVKMQYTIDASETETPSIAVTNNGGWTVTATQPEDGKGSVKITAPAEATQGTTVTFTFTDGDYQVAQEVEVLLKAPNAWEAIVQAGAEYTKFRDLISAYNVLDEDGNVTGNTYLDMYDASGSKTWTMQMEDGVSTTLLLPSNEILDAAIAEASETLKNTLGREPNKYDLKKFNDWILRACFYPEALTAAQLGGSADLNGVSGVTSAGKEVEAALWRPAAQKLSGESKKLINGNAYYLSKLHIPNYIVIYRIKQVVADAYDVAKAAGTVNDYLRFENCKLTRRTNNNDASKNIRSVISVLYTTADGRQWQGTSTQLAVLHADGGWDYTTCEATCEIEGKILSNGALFTPKIPKGTYMLCLGYGGRNNEKALFDVDFRTGGNDYIRIEEQIMVSDNYDFSGGGYAEGFRDYLDEFTVLLGNNVEKFDRDGTEKTTVTFSEDNLPFNFKLTSKSLGWSDKGGMTIYHWTLRPTTDVY